MPWYTSHMINLVQIVVLTGAAGVLAYVGNTLAFRRMGCRSTLTVVPWWEEGCKFAAITLLPGHPLFTVHMVFGLAEFTHDLWRDQCDGLFLPLLTLIGHGLFGSLAVLAANTLGHYGWAYPVTAVAHSLFSAAVVFAVLPTLGAGPFLRAGRR
ncbi:MAG TPA: hypothetical protein VD902_03575 [Symbiobacteriaceae bacterium]|nr:hypothetical protein [Symbiobacteriaceae bacterium]